MKEKTMAPIMTDTPNPAIYSETTEEKKSLTAEDLNYLKMLNNKTKDIKYLLGELEISKMKLIRDHDIANGKETDFISSLYPKYNIDPTKNFGINPDSGEITIQKS